jgi:hypothetical protein
MNHIDSFQFRTDDHETVSIFLGDAIHEIDDDGEVTLQVPVFADGRSGHFYISSKELVALSKNPVVRRATQWALNTRLNSHHPRLPKR